MKKFCTVILLLVALVSNGQIVFEKGYFINNSGARTDCFIRNLDWRYNPVDFEYKLTAEGTDVIKETIANVQEFSIENASRYKRYKLQIERSYSDAKRLAKSRYPEFHEETLFLNALVSGDANLYVYKDGPQVKFFYETAKHPIEQLVYIRYINDNGDAAENAPFRQQLLNHVKTEKVSENELKKLKYSQDELTAYFKKFNNGGEVMAAQQYKSHDRKVFAFHIVAGVGQTSLAVEGPWNTSGFYNDTKLSVDAKSVLKAGIEFEYVLPFNKNSWSIFTRPTYQKYEATQQYGTFDLYNNYNSNNEIAVNYSSIELPIGLRYHLFINPASKVYFDFAFVMDFPMDSKITFSGSKNAPFEISSGYSACLGVGYEYKKVGVMLLFNTPREILNDYSNWSAKYKSIGFALTYKIF